MRPAYEVADVIRKFLPKLNKQKMYSHHLRTLTNLEQCRTSAMGGHIDECDSCGHLKISYNSCGDRHCPKCQGISKEIWIIQQEDMLLPISYFHVVFTMPQELNELCMYQPKFMYNLLFRAAWHTLSTFAKDPKWLGAKSAATMVLHTWSQTLSLHPHVHCIVPNGGLKQAENNFKWQFPKQSNGKKEGNFLYPVSAMKKVYKGFFLSELKKEIERGTLALPPSFPYGFAYKKWKDNLYKKEWVVYTKKPFGGVKHVVNYLARYSHRVAITNHRIKKIDDESVLFEYKDYKDGGKKKPMSLKGREFLRRFCLHILPKGYRKIRQYGFLSNASKGKSLALARIALGERVKVLLTKKERKELALQRLFKGVSDKVCPCCQKGKMVQIDSWERLSKKNQKNKSPPSIQIVPKQRPIIF